MFIINKLMISLISPALQFGCLLLSFMLLGAYQPVAAQIVFRGTIADAETGESLPAANIQIEGTYLGTITNSEGAFSLEVESLPAVLLVQFIGYETERIPVTSDSPTTLQIALSPTVYQLGELVVSDENLAITIMRKVIEQKQTWREALDAYEAEAYTRFTLENDTGIVSIIESVTDVFWQQDQGLREVVKAQRKTSNLEFDEFLPAAQFMANLYDDDIEIAGYTFIGVTHPDALKHYIFELAGRRYLDEQLVYDIEVRPRNKFKSGFRGRIAVLDEAFAVLEVQLEPGAAFLFPPPINGFDILFEQQFSNFGGAFWLPVDFRSRMDLEIGFGRLLAFPTIHVEQVSRMTAYAVNVAVPDSVFSEDNKVLVDSAAVAVSDALTDESLAVPLDRAEAAAYESIDSTMTLERAYEPTGVLARFADVNVEVGDEDGTESDSSNKRIDLGIEPTGTLRFNRVEGLYAELGLQRSFGDHLSLQGGAGYSTVQSGDARWSYRLGGKIGFGVQNRFSLHSEYAQYTDTQTPTTSFLQILNSGVVLFSGRDYYDYFRNNRFRSSLTWQNAGLDSRLSVGIRLEEHASLEKETDFDLLGMNTISRPNPSIEEGRLRSFTADVQLGDDGDTGGFTGKKSLNLSIEHSDPSLMDSDFSFTTYNAVLDWRFNTFFQRRFLPNTLDVRIEAGTSSGEVPFQRLGAINGPLEFIGLFGTLKTRATGPYRGDRHAAIFWEHNFRTVPFELLGLNRMAENAYNLIVFGGHGRNTFPDRLQLDASGPAEWYQTNGWHHELGISLSGVFTVLRLDFAKRLDGPGTYFGISTSRIF